MLSNDSGFNTVVAHTISVLLGDPSWLRCRFSSPDIPFTSTYMHVYEGKKKTKKLKVIYYCMSLSFSISYLLQLPVKFHPVP